MQGFSSWLAGCMVWGLRQDGGRSEWWRRLVTLLQLGGRGPEGPGPRCTLKVTPCPLSGKLHVQYLLPPSSPLSLHVTCLLCVCMCTHMHMEGSEVSSQESDAFFHHVGLGNLTEVIRQGHKGLYPLSHPAVQPTVLSMTNLIMGDEVRVVPKSHSESCCSRGQPFSTDAFEGIHLIQASIPILSLTLM